jgi:hypothetical protein
LAHKYFAWIVAPNILSILVDIIPAMTPDKNIIDAECGTSCDNRRPQMLDINNEQISAAISP